MEFGIVLSHNLLVAPSTSCKSAQAGFDRDKAIGYYLLSRTVSSSLTAEHFVTFSIVHDIIFSYVQIHALSFMLKHHVIWSALSICFLLLTCLIFFFFSRVEPCTWGYHVHWHGYHANLILILKHKCTDSYQSKDICC